MALKLLSSGGGSVTLDVPSTASNLALTVPASNGTVVVGSSTDFNSGTAGLLPRTILPSGSFGGGLGMFDGGKYSGFWTQDSGKQLVFFSDADTSTALGTKVGAVITQNGVGLGFNPPMASGIGVRFPPTQSASTDANTLDDYEEGSWSPNIGGDATYSNQFGRYTKIGNKVFVEAFLEISSKGTGAGGDIFGLPFVANAAAGPLGTASVGYFAGSATSFSYLSATIGQNGTSINLRFVAAGGSTAMGAPSFFQNGTAIFLTANYTV